MRHLVGAISLLLVLTAASCAEKNYTETVLTLQRAMQAPGFKGKSYERLAYLSDTYGPRMWGSEVLEMAIDEVKRMAEKEGFENVRLEPVTGFTRWTRKTETLTLLAPRTSASKLDLIGIGGTVPWYAAVNAATSRQTSSWLGTGTISS